MKRGSLLLYVIVMLFLGVSSVLFLFWLFHMGRSPFQVKAPVAVVYPTQVSSLVVSAAVSMHVFSPMPFVEGCVRAVTECEDKGQQICLLGDLIVHRNEMYSPRLPLTLDVTNVGVHRVSKLPTAGFLHVPTLVFEGITVVMHRLYPHNYGHAIRDTLAHAFFVYTQFYSNDTAQIRHDLNMVYLDGVITTGGVRSVHFALGNTTIEGTGAETILIRRAVIGMFGDVPIDNCMHHNLRPHGWRAFAATMAFYHAFPQYNKIERNLIWLSNRGEGDSREVLNMYAIAEELGNYSCFTGRTGDLSLHLQVMYASRTWILIGPHGSNLAVMMWGGPDISVIELLASSFLSHWWFNQAMYQGSRWVSVPDQVEKAHDLGDGRISPTPSLVRQEVQGLLTNQIIRCQFPGLATSERRQACTSSR